MANNALRGVMRILFLATFLFTNILHASHVAQRYDTEGQAHYYVTPTGTGDCTSWKNPCSFRIAESKCSDAVLDVIHLGAGTHDLDNLSDASGSEVDKDYVTIRGLQSSFFATTLANGDAAATHVLTITSSNVALENLRLDNSEQSDTNVILLNLKGASNVTMENVLGFQSLAAIGTGTGLLLDDGFVLGTFRNMIFNRLGIGIHTNGAAAWEAYDVQMNANTTGYWFEGTNDTFFRIIDGSILFSTTGIDADGSSMSNIIFKRMHLTNNSVNIDLDAAAPYNSVQMDEITNGTCSNLVYPLETGVSVDSGEGEWTWTAAAVEVIPPDTIATPFFINGFNIQSYDASQTYKVHVYTGEAAGDTCRGIWEFTVGLAAGGKHTDMFIKTSTLQIPANSGVYMKVMSSTAGVDSLIVTVNYLQL